MSRPYYQQADDLFLAALAAVPGLGPKRLNRLYRHSGTWQAAWHASESVWQEKKIPIISIKAWQNKKSMFSPEKFASYLQTSNTALITSQHPDYPAGFNDLENAPLLLYARGTWPKTKKIITVIGSRQPTPYGEAAAARFVPYLTAAGYSLASGLAAGLDTCAHRLSLINNGHTIAILGSGLDYIYPKNNKSLALEIIRRGGLLLSEYPPTAAPLKANFIQRNRLLAAIAEITLVLEAGLKSGSILTARTAKKLGRTVYAVPGNIFSSEAAGCHRLIQENARLAVAPTDICPEKIINLESERNSQICQQAAISPEMEAIIQLLKIDNRIFTGLTADEISHQLQLDTASVNSTLSILEIRKLLCRRQGRYYFQPSN